MTRPRPTTSAGAKRVSYQRRFTEAVAVGMLATSSRTCVTVSACTRSGRAYVRLQSFYRPAGAPTTGWRLGHRIVLPAAVARALLPLLEQAAAQAEQLPGALSPSETNE